MMTVESYAFSFRCASTSSASTVIGYRFWRLQVPWSDT